MTAIRRKTPNAVKYDTLTFLDVLNKNLQVMDSTAASLCRDNKIGILVLTSTNRTTL